METNIKALDYELQGKCDLSNIKTCILAKELKSREGVIEYNVAPYEKEEYIIDGPATVLIIID